MTSTCTAEHCSADKEFALIPLFKAPLDVCDVLERSGEHKGESRLDDERQTEGTGE